MWEHPSGPSATSAEPRETARRVAVASLTFRGRTHVDLASRPRSPRDASRGGTAVAYCA